MDCRLFTCIKETTGYVNGSKDSMQIVIGVIGFLIIATLGYLTWVLMKEE